MDFLILQVFHLEKREIAFGSVNVEKGVSSSINAILSEDASFFIKKSKSGNVTQNVTFKENLEAPIEKGEVIRKCHIYVNVTYTMDNEEIKSINIIAENEVKKINLLNMTAAIYKDWFNMLR